MSICVTSLLRDKGFKVTPQRLAIYNYLSSTKAHPNAEMIFNELQPVYPTMSLATVYKTMEILREIGLVQILNVGEDSFRYDAFTDNHAHVRCMSCGRVEDVHELGAAQSDDLAEEVNKSTSYKVTGQQFYFFFFFPDCQKKPAN